MELAGRRVMITGASRGIGKAIAERCAAAGARVALVARSEGPLKELAASFAGATYFPTDLGEAAAVDGLIERVEADGGPVDVLINNAGVATGGDFADMAPDDIEQIYRLNLLTPVQLCRQVLPGMLARGQGHIVNVSSMAGCVGFPGMAAYASSKAGLTHFTAILRADLRGRPVGTTLVEVGFVPTDMLAAVNEYRPSLLSKQRTDLLRLSVDVSVDELSQAVADAISKGRRHVRLPRREAAYAVLPELGRRAIEVILTGVPHQD